VLQCENLSKLLEILKNHFLSSARFRNVLQPHYIAKKEMIEINKQTTTKVEYPMNLKLLQMIVAKISVLWYNT
jgi:predicted RNA binding protein with dsRBD fold (UPF0201 family)